MNYHFIGIGGCGMSALAAVLAKQGHRVTGSDMQSSEVIDRLGRCGIMVNIGHFVENVPLDTEIAVISAAINDKNVELQAIKAKEIPVYKYAEMLGQLTRQLKTIAIAGTHGKSTTSAWTANSLRAAGKDPSFIIGADVHQLDGGGSGAGAGEFMVVEACEYDRSFLNLSPYITTILNIEADHLDYYKDIEDIKDAFADFCKCTTKDGLVIYNKSDTYTNETIERFNGNKIGFGDGGNWNAQNIELIKGCGYYDLCENDTKIARVKLKLAGLHNVYNSLAVAAMCRAAGLDNEQIIFGLENFLGVSRRMTYKGMVAGITVLDDYAHHPTEIQATLTAIRDYYEPRCLWCVFQPHQYSRTRFLLEDFAISFEFCDIVLLPEIYFVRDSEQHKQEIDAAKLADKINESGHCARYLGDFDNILDYLSEHCQPGDLVVTMGAGNIWELADDFICRLGKNC